MISFFKRKVTILLAAVLILGTCTVSTVYASNSKTIQAQQGVVIMYNGKKLTDTNQPYLINNTTYIPLRMLVNHFNDKSIKWDATKKQVIVTDNVNLTGQLAIKDAEIQRLKAENTTLANKVSTLEKQTSTNQDADLSDIEDKLDKFIEDAGDDYFGDEGIEVAISLDGDEDDVTYKVTLDFDDADDYDDLKEISKTKIKDFLDDLESKISDQAEDTDYEDADITGKAVDNDNSSHYVKYNGSSYTYSWDDDDDADLGDIEDELDDYVADAGDDYFGDEGIEVAISLDGDEDDLTYEVTLDFDDADDYDDLAEISESKIEDLLDDLESEISDQAEDTDYEDADITGKAVDNDNPSHYVKYNGSSYDYSWD